MDIYTFKKQFEKVMQPAPTYTLIDAEQAWGHFKSSVLARLDEETCEELGFSASLASPGENLFQIYFGRLIDAGPRHPWRVAEINFYYRYELNPELRALLAGLQTQDIETAYCNSEDADIIRQKIEGVFAFADGLQPVWAALRDLKPARTSFHFWLQ